MWIATKQIEITVPAANGPAALGHLMAVVTSCGTEVLAACSYWGRDGAVVMLVTEKALRARHALEAAGFRCQSTPIVLVETPDKPGLAARLGRKLLSSGIDILYSYTFRSQRGQSYAVFRTSDDDRAIYTLEFEAVIQGLATARRPNRPAKPKAKTLKPMPLAA